MRVAVALLVLAGCVVDPDVGPAPACERDADCAVGQTCREQVCYGGSSGDYAAELFAPASRSDMLARAEIMSLDVSEGGDVGVMFTDSVQVSGRVLLRATDSSSAAARIDFRRPSRIAGAPDYVVSVNALPGKARGELAFKARLTPNEGSEKYSVTVYPDDGTLYIPPAGALKPNALAPPTIIPLQATADRTFDITLDAGGLKGLTGLILDAVGNGMDGMLVRAYARTTTPGGAPELISSTGTTDADGRYEIWLPVGRAGLFDLVVSPQPGNHNATLTRRGVRVPDASVQAGVTSLSSIVYPALPDRATYQLPVMGPVASGGSREAVGATVLFSATLSAGPIDTVIYETQASVDSHGLATAELVPGALAANRMYKVTVLPPANAQQGARWDATIALGPPPVGGLGGVLPEVELPKRIFVTGKILDHMGMGAGSMNIRPQLSAAFLSTLTDEQRQRVAAIALPEVTADDKGTFTVYLDRSLVGMDATYDLELIPPSASRLPRWSRDGVQLGAAAAEKLDLGMTALPATTLATGTVLDKQLGAPVPDAEVRVYMRDPDTRARLRTLARSDKDGKVVLVLPSP